MRGLFVDTGVWVALVDVADPRHRDAKAILDGHHFVPLITTDMVVSETVTLLVRHVGAARGAAFGDVLVGGTMATVVRTEEADWLYALTLIRKFQEQKLSFADGTSFGAIRRLDIEKAASFDRHFRIVLPEREVIGPA